MELVKMVQKPGEWNFFLQSHRYLWTATAHLHLCWGSCVRTDATISEQMYRSRAICFNGLWFPGGFLQLLSYGQQPLLGKIMQRLRQSMRLDRRWFHSCKKGVFMVSVTAWKRCQGFLTGLAPLPFSCQHLERLHPPASSAWLPSARAPLR